MKNYMVKTPYGDIRFVRARSRNAALVGAAGDLAKTGESIWELAAYLEWQGWTARAIH